jgi:glycosyltransferase involved in cell wall biosynthesis
MREAVRGFGHELTAVSVSFWLRRRAEQSPILDGVNHRVIGNGIDTEIFTYRPGKQPIQERILFHATALFSDDPSHPKGGYYLLELARRMEDQSVRFLVAGKHRINGELPPNVTLLGEVRDQNRLAQYYSAADLTILTSRAESFSLVCAESLCCGTPVAGFRAGGPEEIALDAYSRFVEFGDVEQLLTAVREMLDVWAYDPEAVSRTARKYYGKEHMLQNYLKLYQGVL